MVRTPGALPPSGPVPGLYEQKAPALILGGSLLLFVVACAIHLLAPRKTALSLGRSAQVLTGGPDDARYDGRSAPVAIQGVLRLPQGIQLGDPGFLLPSDYVELWRDVEMYAWHEEGVQVQPAGPITYRYVKKFSADPPASAEFHQQEGHENPPVPLRSAVRSVPLAFVGPYRFVPRRAYLAAAVPLPLSPEILDPPDRQADIRQGVWYLTSSRSRRPKEVPEIGDLRIRYRVVRAGTLATLFGELHGKEITPHYGSHGQRLYHLIPGKPDQILPFLPLLQLQRPLLLGGP